MVLAVVSMVVLEVREMWLTEELFKVQVGEILIMLVDEGYRLILQL